MKNFYTVFFTLMLFALPALTKAQCDLAVEIKANPSADLCLGESVQLIAVTNQEVEIPANCEVVADLNCEVGSVPFSANLDDGTSVNAQGASLPDIFGDINEGQVRSQVIYRASEIIATGFEGGKIKGMEFELARVDGDATIPNFEIKIGCTPEDDFDAAFLTGMTTVFDNKSVNLSTGFNTFNFDRAYNWNGADNIVIQICMYAAPGSPGNFKNFTRDQFLAYPAVRVARTILSTGNCEITSSARNSNQRPNTRFVTCKPELKDFTYKWSPAATLSSTTARDPFADPETNTTYDVEVFENINPGCVATDQITITVVDPSNFTPTANTPLCEGSTLTLNANTPADGYLWIGPNGYTSTSANPSITNVTPAMAGTYSLFVEKGFCKANKELEVEVEVELSSGTVLPDPGLCNSEPTFNLYSLLQNQEVNATSKWTDDSGSGILNGNSINPQNVPVADLPATFRYTYSLENSCGIKSSTVSITIYEAPDPGLNGTAKVCNEDNQSIDLNTFLGGTPDAGGTWVDFNNTGQMNANGTVNLFGFNAGVYSFYYRVNGIGACPEDSSKVDVTVVNYKVAGTGGSVRVCKGETLSLTDYLTGFDTGGLWVDVDNSSGLTNPNTGAFNSTSVAPGTYTFDYLIDNQDPCTDNKATVTVIVTKKPEIFNPTTFCNAAETFFQLQFEIKDGNPNTLTADVTANGTNYGYNVALQSGVWVFTTDLIPEGEEVSVTISDADACGSSTYSVRKRCGCVTDAGVQNLEGVQTICDGSFYSVKYIGGFIDDGDDNLEFILHDRSDAIIGTIYDRNTTGTFGYTNGLSENTTYYISAVAGNQIPGTTQVDLNDGCVDIRAGQPVRFISLPDPVLTMTPDTACIGGNISLNASNVPNNVNYEWQGPGVSSPNLFFDIIGISQNLLGTYNFVVNKGICTDTFKIDVIGHEEPNVVVPTSFLVCADVQDSIPVELKNLDGAAARFQTEDATIIDLNLQNGFNYLTRTFSEPENIFLKEIDYANGCTKSINQNIAISLEQVPEISFDLVSPSIICASANPTAQLQFSINPASATGEIVYDISGLQANDQPIIGNDSIITIPAVVDGENIFNIRKYVSRPKGCSYALDFGTESFFNYEEPNVSFNVELNKICRGDSAFIPIKIDASDNVVVIYSINQTQHTFTAKNDTLLGLFQSNDFDFSIDSVYYEGGNGCGKLIELSQTFEVKDPINFNVTPVKNDCKGESDGRILLQADGANTTFSMDGQTYFARSSFDNLPSGNYTVFAQAASGCISVKNTTIENKSNLELNINKQNTTCGNENGSLQVVAINGSEPYHIFINDEEFDNGVNQTNLAGDEFIIYAYDNLACEVRDTVVVESSEGVDFTAIQNGPLTCIIPDGGIITVAATGGSGNYAYQLGQQAPQTSATFTGLNAQFYNIQVIDTQDGCVKKQRVRISPLIQFSFTAKIVRGLDCHNSENGIVQAITEDNGEDFVYSLDGINYTTSNTFTNVKPGNFELYAKELTGCRREQNFSFILAGPEEVKTKLSYSEDVTCWNDEDASVSLSASGGNGAPYSFKNLASGGFSTNPVFNNLGQGLHHFATRDKEGCMDTLAVRIYGPDTVEVTVTKIDSSQGRATIRISATNTHLQTLYSLDGVNYSTNPIFENVDPGNYTAYVKDQRGCETAYTFNLTVTGIAEKTQEMFTVYPNPFSSEIHVSFENRIPDDLNSQLMLMDLTGKKIPVEIVKESANAIRLNFNNDLASGLYLLKYNTTTLRIVKN